MSLKKILGLVGVIICILLLILTAFRIMSWTLFWIIIILMAGFAYFVLPRMED